MIERTSSPLSFGDMFISISLDISNIEAEEDSDIDKLDNFNISV